ncbi:hypothetical protein HK105_208620 [Polyrhizophydium stewartii]|uniref:Uncharacterized protein n=1 Tax=Polyrhizophydium stewartii TaxID=2732419 RepID=A0ABR4MXB0_9FUNG
MARLGFSSGSRKIVVVGSAASGKTTLVQKYVGGTPPSEYQQTFGAELFVKNTNEGKKHSLQIWCCGGHERYRALLDQFYIEANVVLVCFDMQSLASFQEVTFWYNEAKRTVPDASVILVGTKADDLDSSIVKIQDAMKVSKDWGIDFRTVSAKTNANVDDLFDLVITKL